MGFVKALTGGSKPRPAVVQQSTTQDNTKTAAQQEEENRKRIIAMNQQGGGRSQFTSAQGQATVGRKTLFGQ